MLIFLNVFCAVTQYQFPSSKLFNRSVLQVVLIFAISMPLGMVYSNPISTPEKPLPANVALMLTCDNVTVAICDKWKSNYSHYAEFKKVCTYNYSVNVSPKPIITCHSWCDAMGGDACQLECPGKFAIIKHGCNF